MCLYVFLAIFFLSTLALLLKWSTLSPVLITNSPHMHTFHATFAVAIYPTCQHISRCLFLRHTIELLASGRRRRWWRRQRPIILRFRFDGASTIQARIRLVVLSAKVPRHALPRWRDEMKEGMLQVVEYDNDRKTKTYTSDTNIRWLAVLIWFHFLFFSWQFRPSDRIARLLAYRQIEHIAYVDPHTHTRQLTIDIMLCCVEPEIMCSPASLAQLCPQLHWCVIFGFVVSFILFDYAISHNYNANRATNNVNKTTRMHIVDGKASSLKHSTCNLCLHLLRNVLHFNQWISEASSGYNEKTRTWIFYLRKLFWGENKWIVLDYVRRKYWITLGDDINPTFLEHSA